MKEYPEKLVRSYESSDENRKIQEAYEAMLNPMINEDAIANAKKSLDAIIGALSKNKGKGSDDMLKMAQGILKTFKKNKGFSTKQAEWIYKTSKALF